jgi:tripartite-type tricarboxylate transporter receptor subunit TctC
MNEKPRLHHFRVMVSALALGLAAAVVSAQSYPVKRITMIAGYPAGGGTDLQARLVAQKLAEKWGRPVVVDNLAGGMGIISVRAVANAAPDGYTIYMGASDHLIMLPALYDNLPFDTVKDLLPVSPVANQHVALVVHPSVPVRSVRELVALAKSKPEQITFASVGAGSISHLAAELFQTTTAVKLIHIPYKGSAPAFAELMSGQGAAMIFASLATATPHIKSGRMRALALTAAERSPALPDVPTAAEAGLPGFVMFSWNGVFAPVGTPREIIGALNSEIVRILRQPDIVERMSSLGLQPTGSTPEEFAALIRSDLDKWAKIVRDAGIQRQQM